MKKSIVCMVIVFTLLIRSTTFADEAGDTLAKKFFGLPESDTFSSDMTLVIIDDKGNKKSRAIKSFSRTQGDETDSYVEFLSPADVAGTKFLTNSKKGKDDEQRLFLPALGKIRRIASSDKDGSFMGTELNYYDMEDHDIEDFTYNALGTKTVNKKQVNVLEATPIDEDVPYSKQIFYLDQTTNYPVLIECYDLDGKLLKKIYNLKTETIKGVIIAERVVVENIQNNQKTLMASKNVIIDEKVPNKYFSVQNLKN